MDWIPTDIAPDDVTFLRIARDSVDMIANEFRVPSHLLREEIGRSPAYLAGRAIGRSLATQGYIRALLYHDQFFKDRGPSHTPPISRKFFPPRWHR